MPTPDKLPNEAQATAKGSRHPDTTYANTVAKPTIIDLTSSQEPAAEKHKGLLATPNHQVKENSQLNISIRNRAENKTYNTWTKDKDKDKDKVKAEEMSRQGVKFFPQDPSQKEKSTQQQRPHTPRTPSGPRIQALDQDKGSASRLFNQAFRAVKESNDLGSTKISKIQGKNKKNNLFKNPLDSNSIDAKSAQFRDQINKPATDIEKNRLLNSLSMKGSATRLQDQMESQQSDTNDDDVIIQDSQQTDPIVDSSPQKPQSKKEALVNPVMTLLHGLSRRRDVESPSRTEPRQNKNECSKINHNQKKQNPNPKPDFKALFLSLSIGPEYSIFETSERKGMYINLLDQDTQTEAVDLVYEHPTKHLKLEKMYFDAVKVENVTKNELLPFTYPILKRQTIRNDTKGYFISFHLEQKASRGTIQKENVLKKSLGKLIGQDSADEFHVFLPANEASQNFARGVESWTTCVTNKLEGWTPNFLQHQESFTAKYNGTHNPPSAKEPRLEPAMTTFVENKSSLLTIELEEPKAVIPESLSDPTKTTAIENKRTTRNSLLKIDVEDSENPMKKPDSTLPDPSIPGTTIILRYPYSVPNSTEITQNDRLRLEDSEFLNDTLLELGFRHILETHRTNHSDLADQIHVFNTFFYKKLSQSKPKNSTDFDAYQLVRKWTNKINLFSHKYVVVPINENLHWYLALIINPAAILASKFEEPPESPKAPESLPTPSTEFFTSKEKENGNEMEVDPPRTELEKSATMIDPPPLAQPSKQLQEISKYFDKSLPEVLTCDDTDDEADNKQVSSQLQEKAQDAMDVEVLDAVQDDSTIRMSNRPPPVSFGPSSSAPKVKGEETTESKPEPECLEIVDGSKCYVLILDSLGARHPAVAQKLVQYLIKEAKDKKQVEVLDETRFVSVPKVDVPQQPNFCDCGLYVLHYTEVFLANVDAVLPLAITTSKAKKKKIVGYEDLKNRLWEGELALSKRQQMRKQVDEWARVWQKEHKPGEEKKALEERELRRAAKEKERGEREKQKQAQDQIEPVSEQLAEAEPKTESKTKFKLDQGRVQAQKKEQDVKKDEQAGEASNTSQIFEKLKSKTAQEDLPPPSPDLMSEPEPITFYETVAASTPGPVIEEPQPLESVPPRARKRTRKVSSVEQTKAGKIEEIIVSDNDSNDEGDAQLRKDSPEEHIKTRSPIPNPERSKSPLPKDFPLNGFESENGRPLHRPRSPKITYASRNNKKKRIVPPVQLKSPARLNQASSSRFNRAEGEKENAPKALREYDWQKTPPERFLAVEIPNTASPTLTRKKQKTEDDIPKTQSGILIVDLE